MSKSSILRLTEAPRGAALRRLTVTTRQLWSSTNLNGNHTLDCASAANVIPHLKPPTRTFTSAANTTREFVQVEKYADKRVALVRLHRPKALNALCKGLGDELIAALQELDDDDSVLVMVLTGSEKAFAAGADIKEMLDKNHAEALKCDMLSPWASIQSIRKPIIAAVNGYALGGGCELAMMCDMIIAGDKAKFGQPEILLGTIPGMGGSQRLTRIVGKSKAMEWVLTGRHFDAYEAEKAGLVCRVVESSKLQEEAIKLAESIAKFSMPTIIAAKECVNRAYESSLQEGLLFERRAFHSSFANWDRQEGMSAFVEKRAPQWQHK